MSATLPRLTTPRADADLDRHIGRIPEVYRDELLGYLRHGIPTGSFMAAVLENNLLRSWQYADTEARAALLDIVGYLHDYAPFAAWGSPFAVQAWCARGAAARARAAAEPEAQS